MARNAKGEFLLTEAFISGFQDKLEESEVPYGSAVVGSYNFALDDDGKWVTRPGSAYLGTISTLTGNTTNSGRLRRRDGTELPIVSFGTRTKYLHPRQNQPVPGQGGTPDWVILEEGLTNGAVMGFATNDLNSDNNNKMIMSNAQDNYRIWTGAIDLVSQWSSSTIITQSPFGLAAELFAASGSINISTGTKVKTFNYTGITASTFTGVTPDPNLGLDGSTPLLSGMAITQTPTQYASAPKGNVLLCTDNARVLVANAKNTNNVTGGGQVFGSKTNNPTDFTFSTPRVATDGFILNVAEGGGTVTGLVQQENINYIFKPSTIKRLTFSQDGNDVIQIQSLSSYDEKTSGDDGAISALAVFRGLNSIVFVTPNNVINTVRRVERVDYPIAIPISDPIKNTTDEAVFDTTTAGISWRGRVFISHKRNSDSTLNDQILVYNERYQVWETPIRGLNVSSFFVYGGNLYGTLANSPDVVQLWTGTSDFVYATQTDIPINAELRLGRQNLGTKVDRKEFFKFYIEGEMFQTGSATFKIEYDENGEVRSGTLSGTETGFFYEPAAVGGFGTEGFAVDTFGPSGDALQDSNSPVKFRLIVTTTQKPFFNYQFRVVTSSFFKLIACGPAAHLTEFVHPGSIYKALS